MLFQEFYQTIPIDASYIFFFKILHFMFIHGFVYFSLIKVFLMSEKY